MFKQANLFAVTLSVPSKLGVPIVPIDARAPAVGGAAMPKAAVHVHSQLQPCERNVGANCSVGEPNPEIYSKPEA
jgi:hypothetical protein